AFADASRRLTVVLGAVNTAVLICSSLTMALAVRSAQRGTRRGVTAFLSLTMLLGSVFLVIKGVEYAHKFHDHLMPGATFAFEGPHRQHAELFFSFYFAMTGLHALHMMIGIGILGALVVLSSRGRFSPDDYAPVENTGLYWHFVDIIWIFLFPLLYLISRT
ncbi:MAG: cytochrome c oxidase subunit 3, partial [Candidatus Methylomirabilaceae bacterium]